MNNVVKKCVRCGVFRSLELFYLNRYKLKDGSIKLIRTRECRLCKADRQRDYRRRCRERFEHLSCISDRSSLTRI